MGGDSKAHWWAVRITISEQNTLEKIQAFCREHMYVKLACKELADDRVPRDHTHIACVSLDKPLVRSTIKAHLSKFLDLSGNGDYSMRQPEPDETLHKLYNYICKGTSPDYAVGPPIIIHNFLNTIDVIKHHADYWEINAKLQAEAAAFTKKAAKDGRKLKSAVIAKLSDKYKGKGTEQGTLFDIVKDIVKEYKGDVNDQTLFTATQAIAWTIDSDNTETRAASRLLSRLCGRINSNSIV